jgi:hypothetical protein
MKINRITLAAVAISAILGQSLLAQVPPDSLTNGLVAYYAFDGDCKDSSGHGNDGIISGSGLTFGMDRFARPGRAVSFDGQGAQIELPATLNGVVPTTNQTMTVSFWMKKNGVGNVLSKFIYPFPEQSNFRITFSALSDYYLYVLGTGVNYVRIRPETSRDWSHFVVEIAKGATAKVFQDSVLVAQGSVNLNPIVTDTKILIGKTTGSDPQNFSGILDDLRIYNRALSVAELNALYIGHQILGLGSSIVEAPVGLIGWWPGDGNAKDLAGGNTGILVNARTVPGYNGDAFVFAGQNSYVQIPNSPAINSITNAITLEAWVWHDATGATIQRYVTLTADAATILYDNGPIKFELHFVNPAALVPLRSDMSVEPRKWYHVVGTYDGKEQRLYINGVRVGVAVINRPTGWLPGSELAISIAGQAMNGLIDEAAVYNRALTAEEIQSHFVAGSAGMAKAPVFSAIGLSFPGNARLSIKGQAGKAVTIQSSGNLLDWTTLTTDPNLTGRIDFTDSSAGAFSHRFYRAVAK